MLEAIGAAAKVVFVAAVAYDREAWLFEEAATVGDDPTRDDEPPFDACAELLTEFETGGAVLVITEWLGCF